MFPWVSVTQASKADTQPKAQIQVHLGEINPVEAKIKPLPDFDKEVAKPLKDTQDREAKEAAERDLEFHRHECEVDFDGSYVPATADAAAVCNVTPVYVPEPAPVVTTSYTAPQSVTSTSFEGGLNGSIGYALPYGNCVNEPGVNNPFDGSDPIAWAVLYSNPHIGSTALFTYNHVAVVTGIWSNGDLEVRHQNFTGGQTRFPRSQFRGFR